MRQVQQAAHRCLHSLRQNAHQAAQAQTLLRALPDDAVVCVAELLRPLPGGPDSVSAAELLRVATNDG